MSLEQEVFRELVKESLFHVDKDKLRSAIDKQLAKNMPQMVSDWFSENSYDIMYDVMNSKEMKKALEEKIKAVFLK